MLQRIPFRIPIRIPEQRRGSRRQVIVAAIAGLIAGAIVSLVTHNIASLVATSLFCPSFAYYVPQERDSVWTHIRSAIVFSVGFAILYPLVMSLQGHRVF